MTQRRFGHMGWLQELTQCLVPYTCQVELSKAKLQTHAINCWKSAYAAA